MQRVRNAWFNRLVILALIALGIGTAGCGGNSVPGALKTFPVDGTIMLDGEAFGPARLIFAPDSGGAAPAGGALQGSGLVDKDGKITVTTYSIGDGLPAGKYKVTISSDPMTPAPSHPQIYNDAGTTTLTVTINDTGSNQFELEMDSKAGPMTEGFRPGGIAIPGGVDTSKSYGAPPGTPPGSK